MSKLKVIRIHSDMGDTRIIAKEIIADRFLKGYMLYRPFFQTIDENDFASFETEIDLYISQVCEFHEHPALIVEFKEEGCLGVLITASVDVFIEDLQAVTHTRPEEKYDVEKIVTQFKEVKDEVNRLGLSQKHDGINLEKQSSNIVDKFNQHEHFLLKRDFRERRNIDYVDDTWILVHAADSYHQIENFFRNRCSESKNADNNDFIYCYATKEDCKLLKVQEKLFRIECTAKLINIFVDSGVVKNLSDHISAINVRLINYETVVIEFEPDKHETV